MRPKRTTTRVGLIGAGAIGSVVAAALHDGRVERAALSGVVAGRDSDPAVFDAILGGSDVVVEAASQAAVATYGPRVRDAGLDLVVVSAGALVDDDLLRALTAPPTGRLLLSTGACGGIDLLRAAQLMHPFGAVRLETTKPGAALIRDWMEPDLRETLLAGEEAISVFTGSAREAVQRFPETANIAALIALATIGFDSVEVEVRAEPDAHSATHVISARGEAGTYRFEIENALSPQNLRTSAVTAYAVLRALTDRSATFTPGW
jgi:aspartate dehydrogenase